MAFVTRRGMRLYWRQDGRADGPPLLLLNAIGTDVTLWDAVLPLLARTFRVIRMDTRGHGASDAPPGDYDLQTLAEDALAVLDAAAIPKATVCGLSLGGMVAMTLALVAPDRVSALIAACTSPAMDPEVWEARRRTVLEQGMAAVAEAALSRFFSEAFRMGRPEVVDTVRAGLLATPAAGYAGCAAAIRDMKLAEALGGITVPTLVIAGARDVSTPFEGHGAAIAAAVPGAEALVLDAGHLACLEAPDAFAGAVRDFLLGAERDPAVGNAARVLYEAGLANRRAVLGDAWVDASLARRTPFTADFQAMITRYAWQEIWGRPGLDHRTRRLLVIAITASLGRWEEFSLHVRAGLGQGGFSREDLKETLMQTAIYAGVPAANTAFAEAAAIIAALDEESGAAKNS
ncbi:MAG: 3-oxoadipate enol-lactonase [Caulobacteraceae bacterium]|nr:3-oxoadipate enol-lactonase [Caulobacteraceae bacterium]